MHDQTDLPSYLTSLFSPFILVDDDGVWCPSSDIHEWYRSAFDSDPYILKQTGHSARPITKVALAKWLQTRYPGIEQTLRTSDNGKLMRGWKRLAGPIAQMAKRPGRKPRYDGRTIDFDPFL